MEGDSQPGQREHGQVVGPVTHGNGLGQVYLFHLCDEPEQLCLATAVHHLAQVASREVSGLVYLQLVGIDIIYAELLLQVFPEEGESAR